MVLAGSTAALFKLARRHTPEDGMWLPKVAGESNTVTYATPPKEERRKNKINK